MFGAKFQPNAFNVYWSQYVSVDMHNYSICWQVMFWHKQTDTQKHRTPNKQQQQQQQKNKKKKTRRQTFIQIIQIITFYFRSDLIEKKI